MLYYSFTSLTTVGFGDIYPTNDSERLVIAFLLLFGVAIFSYVMGNFLQILSEFNALVEDIDGAEELNKFM